MLLSLQANLGFNNTSLNIKPEHFPDSSHSCAAMLTVFIDLD